MAAFLLDEKKLLNENIFLHEQRLNSQYTRFLDKNQTYVNYFNINNIESTADIGFQDVERVLGPNSPVRYKEIKDLPMYGIDQILLDLSAEDQGLDTNFEGDAIILPNTVKPLPNDFFTITYLNQDYLFMVISVAYDTIKSNNFYKITFNVKALDTEAQLLAAQTTEKYNCIFTNIGTKDKCLIKSDEIGLLLQLNEAYSKIAERYKMFFYSTKYNAFMFEDEVRMPTNTDKYYDRYLSHFINEHQLFNEKNNYKSFYLTTERMDHRFTLEYHDSIYRAVELNKRNLLGAFKYQKFTITDMTSIFSIYRDYRVRDIKLGKGDEFYVPMELITNIVNNKITDADPVSWETLVKYFNNSIDSIYGLKLDKLGDYHSYVSYDLESFIIIPILLYILKTQYVNYMAVI
jgi:hypothetical protein